jgi:hypothetical protein
MSEPSKPCDKRTIAAAVGTAEISPDLVHQNPALDAGSRPHREGRLKSRRHRWLFFLR